MWKSVKKELPKPYKEVLVWVDGHRSPAWSNNYALVAYLNDFGHFRQERHRSAEPIHGVLFWKEIEKPKVAEDMS